MPDTERPRLAPPAHIAFVGLGRMGTPMAGHLASAGYRVTGHDVSDEARQRAREAAAQAGAVLEVPDSLADAARDADAAILMLPDSRIVKQVTGEQGLLSAMPPGSLLIDMSSSEPDATERLARQAAGADIAVVGAPVSGGVIGAAQATLTIMVGGAQPAVERAWPALEVLGGCVLHVGTMPGAGHALKALNNMLSAIHLLATSEAMVAGQRFGLDPAVMLEAINTSSGRSGSTQNKWPNYVLPGTFDSGFSASLLVKDMLIGLGVEREFGTGSHLAQAATEMWRRAATWLPAGADHTEIVRWLENTREGDGEWAELHGGYTPTPRACREWPMPLSAGGAAPSALRSRPARWPACLQWTGTRAAGSEQATGTETAGSGRRVSQTRPPARRHSPLLHHLHHLHQQH